MEEDPELDAIRARIRAELAQPRPPALDRPVDVTDATLAEFVRTHDVVVLDAWAEWCGPCHIISPIVEQLAREWAGKVAFAKLDADANPRAMQRFNIMGLPTLLVFRGGKVIDTLVGAMPKPMIVARVQRAMGQPVG